MTIYNIHLENDERVNNPIEKWANNINKHFTKEQTQITNSHVRDTLTSSQENAN